MKETRQCSVNIVKLKLNEMSVFIVIMIHSPTPIMAPCHLLLSLLLQHRLPLFSRQIAGHQRIIDESYNK